MFGEAEIIGERTASIDSKHRITIPAFTKVETEEELMPQFNILGNLLFVFSKDEFYRRTERFEQFLREQLAEKKITPGEKRRLQRIYYGHLSFMPERVDKGKRMIIPERVVTKLELSDKIFMIGKDTHLELCKDRETYERILQERKERSR